MNSSGYMDQMPEDAQYDRIQNMTNESSIGIIKELDPKNQLNLVRHYLNGEEWDDREKKYIKSFDPVMNEKGVSKFISILAACVSSLTTFSHFREDDISKLALYICKNAIPVIYVYYKEYGITDKSNLSILDSQLLIMTLSALRKAYGAGDRSVIGRTISESINSSMPQPFRDRRNIIDRINPFGTNK